MIRKVSQKDLKGLEAKGAKVRRTAAAEKPKPAEKPIKTAAQKPVDVPMASMKASMQYLDKQAEATRQVIAHNSVMIEGFRKDLKEAVDKVQKRVPYVFDVERGKDKLIQRIVATPQEG